MRSETEILNRLQTTIELKKSKTGAVRLDREIDLLKWVLEEPNS